MGLGVLGEMRGGGIGVGVVEESMPSFAFVVFYRQGYRFDFGGFVVLCRLPLFAFSVSFIDFADCVSRVSRCLTKGRTSMFPTPKQSPSLLFSFRKKTPSL